MPEEQSNINESTNIDELLEQLIPERWSWGYDNQEYTTSEDYKRLLKCTDVQRLMSDWMTKSKRFFVIHAGRRSGKTELSKRIVVDYALSHPKKKIILGAPIYSQASEIWWQDIKTLIPSFFIKKFWDSDLKLQLINGTVIKCVGLDTPERVEGSKLDLIAIDEFADVKQSVLTENILPALSDTKGIALITGTPNGVGDMFHNLVLSIESGKKNYEQWGSYHWTTMETKGFQPEIEAMKSIYSTDLWKQEFMGEFISGVGKAYSYDNKKHCITDEIPISPIYPLDICCDFNTRFMSWPICQSTEDMTYVVDEVTTRNSDIYAQIKVLKQKLIQLHGHPSVARQQQVRFFGDASGSYIRDPAATKSSWDAIKQEFVREGWNAIFCLTRSNPRISDRIATVNSRFQTADGKNHILINPKAEELIKDFEIISFEDMMDEKEKSGKERSHASDGFGYYIYKEFPIQGRTSGFLNLQVLG